MYCKKIKLSDLLKIVTSSLYRIYNTQKHLIAKSWRRNQKGKQSQGSLRLPLILLQQFSWFLIPIINPIVICYQKQWIFLMASVLNLCFYKKSIKPLTVLAATLSVMLVGYFSFNKIITTLQIPVSSVQEQYSCFLSIAFYISAELTLKIDQHSNWKSTWIYLEKHSSRLSVFKSSLL